MNIRPLLENVITETQNIAAADSASNSDRDALIRAQSNWPIRAQKNGPIRRLETRRRRCCWQLHARDVCSCTSQSVFVYRVRALSAATPMYTVPVYSQWGSLLCTQFNDYALCTNEKCQRRGSWVWTRDGVVNWSFWCPELLLASPTYSIPIRALKKFRFDSRYRIDFFRFDSAIW